MNLLERLGLDLADALAGDLELLADLLERLFWLSEEGEPLLDHGNFLLREDQEEIREQLLQIDAELR